MKVKDTTGLALRLFIDLTVDTTTTLGTVYNPLLDIVTLRNPGNIRVFQKSGEASGHGGDVMAEVAIDPTKITLLAGNQFRIYLPANYAPLSGTPAGNLEVRIANVILNFKQGSSSGTPTTAYFFNPNGSVDDTGSYRFEVNPPPSPKRLFFRALHFSPGKKNRYALHTGRPAGC